MTARFTPLAIYHPKAMAEIREALRHYREIDQQYVPGESDLVGDLRGAIVGADWKIHSAPHRWTTHIYGTRRVFLPDRFKYSLIYLPDHQGSPVVLAFAHDRRDRGYWKDRLPPVG